MRQSPADTVGVEVEELAEELAGFEGLAGK